MDESQERATETPPDEPPEKDIDYLLHLLVSVANIGAGLSITLTVNGVVVSGEIIGAADYMDRVAEKASEGSYEGPEGKDIQNTFVQSFKSAAEQIREQLELSKEDEESPAYNYIHIKNAKIYAGNHVLNADMWRGRLDSIDGFAMGRTS